MPPLLTQLRNADAAAPVAPQSRRARLSPGLSAPEDARCCLFPGPSEDRPSLAWSSAEKQVQAHDERRSRQEQVSFVSELKTDSTALAEASSGGGDLRASVNWIGVPGLLVAAPRWEETGLPPLPAPPTAQGLTWVL